MQIDGTLFGLIYMVDPINVSTVQELKELDGRKLILTKKESFEISDEHELRKN